MAIVATADAGLKAVSMGATVLQLRAPAVSAADLEREAARLVATTRVPTLVSSRCDVAIATGASGVNLPERDISVADARRLLGDRIVGRSVHSIESAVEAERDEADFVIFGPIWPSLTHPGRAAYGLDGLAAVVRAIQVPVLAIGGVTRVRAPECLGAGAAGYAAIRMFQ